MSFLVSCFAFLSHDVPSQENELWDKESNHSIGSWAPPTKLKNEGYAESRTSV